MLPIVGFAAAGTLVIVGTKALRRYRRKPGRSVRRSERIYLRNTHSTTPVEEEPMLQSIVELGQTKGQTALTRLTTALTELDDRYQYALQQRFDRITSGTRHAQWQEITGSDAMLEISPDDKMFNRRLARLSVICIGPIQISNASSACGCNISSRFLQLDYGCLDTL